MSDRVDHNGDPRPAPSMPAGLCGGCRHARRVETRVGSVFHLCLRAAKDPAYPRYPALPTLGCPGFERAADG
jgi:hypothetical protein